MEIRSIEELRNNNVKFKDLTLEEVKEYTNGCGSKGSFVKAPNWTFTASCRKHDYSYTLGGQEKDRKKADLGFYDAMLVDCSQYKHKPLLMIYFIIWARIYYLSVRLFGRKFFNYETK